MYDYLVVGAGLFGSVFAHAARQHGKSCVVLDKRAHIAGNLYTECVEGIDVHRYGAHIFHTSNKTVWEYINQFAEFNHFINAPVARYHDAVYNLPFNMNTFTRLWGVKTPSEALAVIERQRRESGIAEPRNLEEQALALVGRDIYETLIKGYTEKQWGRACTELPAFIIRRIPLRFTFDNNYFNDPYQGIPIGGYTELIAKMLTGIEVRLGVDFADYKRSGLDQFEKIVYTGAIDAYFEYCYGELAYRSLCFETTVLDEANYQGVAVVNYTERSVPFTRIIEHKHFAFGQGAKTVVTREYPASWSRGQEPYYPVNDAENNALYERYAELAKTHKEVLFGGRLGRYRYYDMDKVIADALATAAGEFR